MSPCNSSTTVNFPGVFLRLCWRMHSFVKCVFFCRCMHVWMWMCELYSLNLSWLVCTWCMCAFVECRFPPEPRFTGGNTLPRAGVVRLITCLCVYSCSHCRGCPWSQKLRWENFMFLRGFNSSFMNVLQSIQICIFFIWHNLGQNIDSSCPFFLSSSHFTLWHSLNLCKCRVISSALCSIFLPSNQMFGCKHWARVLPIPPYYVREDLMGHKFIVQHNSKPRRTVHSHGIITLPLMPETFNDAVLEKTLNLIHQDS